VSRYVEPGILRIPTFDEYWDSEVAEARDLLGKHNPHGDADDAIASVFDRENCFRAVQMAFRYLTHVESHIAEHKRFGVDDAKWVEQARKELRALDMWFTVWRPDLIRRTAPHGLTDKALALFDRLERYRHDVAWTVPTSLLASQIIRLAASKEQLAEMGTPVPFD
jgi:hypothetical protein